MSFQFNNGVPNHLSGHALVSGILERRSRRLHAGPVDRAQIDRDSRPAPTTTSTCRSLGDARTCPVHATRNIALPEAEGVRWHDLQPRPWRRIRGVGRRATAIRASMNKYLPFYGLQLNIGTEAGTFSTNMAPAARLVVTSEPVGTTSTGTTCRTASSRSSGERRVWRDDAVELRNTSTIRVASGNSTGGTCVGVRRELIRQVCEWTWVSTVQCVGNFWVTDDRAPPISTPRRHGAG